MVAFAICSVFIADHQVCSSRAEFELPQIEVKPLEAAAKDELAKASSLVKESASLVQFAIEPSPVDASTQSEKKECTCKSSEANEKRLQPKETQLATAEASKSASKKFKVITITFPQDSELGEEPLIETRTETPAAAHSGRGELPELESSKGENKPEAQEHSKSAPAEEKVTKEEGENWKKAEKKGARKSKSENHKDKKRSKRDTKGKGNKEIKSSGKKSKDSKKSKGKGKN